MKAAIYNGDSNRLEVKEIQIPAVEKNQILIKIVACGVCHTDLHYLDHGTSTFKKPPIVLGHEASGIVESDGDVFKKGDRVLIPPVFTCGKCKYCREGRENACNNMIMIGNSVNGAFAQYIVVPEKDIVKMPDEIPLEEGCIVADAISTPYHAVVNRAKVRPGDRVLVFGCGGVGINVVQIANLLGAEVIACDIDEDKLALASELGARYTINPEKENLKDFLKKIGGLVDIVFEVIGKPETIEQAYKLVGQGGKLCIVGYTNQQVSINPARIMFLEQEIIGSLGCRPVDFSKILSLIKNNKINLKKLIANKYELSDINTALDELRQGRVLRNIILPNGQGQDFLHN